MARDLDVRLYDRNGKRKRLPQDWIASADFEIGKRGGFQNGTLKIEAKWADLNLDGTEYADLYLQGVLAYRGFGMLVQQELDSPERWSLSLFGLMERTNGYLVRHRYAYASATDIGQVFSDVANDYVLTSERLAGTVLDTTGVAAQGVLLREFSAKGRTVSEAFNQLCDFAPGQFIWGFDVDENGANRLYLRPRAEETKYHFSVGKEVSAFVYPRDSTQVVNRVYVTGADADPPNLALNASFEESQSLDDSENNLLRSPGFEDYDDSAAHAANWTRVFGAMRRSYPEDSGSNLARTGTAWLELGNHGYSGSALEAMEQGAISIGSPQKLRTSVWARQIANGNTDTFTITGYAQDSGGSTLETFASGNFQPASDAWSQFVYEFAPTNSAVTQIVLRFTLTGSKAIGHGVLLDDAILVRAGLTASGWRSGTPFNGYIQSIDWRNREQAYEGEFSVKLKPHITGTDGYAEICARADSEIEVAAGKTYFMSAYFRTSDSTEPLVRLGFRQYADSALVSTNLQASNVEISAFGGWRRVDFSATTSASTNRLEPFIRFYSDGEVYVDAVMVALGSLTPAGVFYSGRAFEAVRSASDYSEGQIGAAAANSIATYGLRERAERTEQVRDIATLDSFAQGYFRAHATPAVQASLKAKGTTRRVALDGKVRIVNLPSAPEALFPSRVRYQIGESFDLEIELNNERPDLAQLLRMVRGANSSAGGDSRITGTGATGAERVGSGYLPLSGGVMTGGLTLSGDPVESLNPATKGYADDLAQSGYWRLFLGKGGS